MDTLTITIGRNIKNTSTPLPDDEWLEFQLDIADTVISVIADQIDWTETHTGQGIYNDIPEDSCKMMYALDEPLSKTRISILKRRLKVIRGRYDQESIAFNIGDSELI